MSVSVVVPVRNAARTLPRCLEALGRLAPGPDEIVLVDNGSTDGSLTLLREFAATAAGRARVVEEPRRGAAAARNRGIAEARGDLVAFTDADCAPAADWLAHLARPLADPEVGAVAGRVGAEPAASMPVVELFSALYTLQSPAAPARRTRWTPWEGGYPTANLAVRRPLLRAVGGFDARLETSGEDYDLCARLYARGAAIAYAPEARVTHHHRTTLRGMLRQAFGFGRGHARLFRHVRGLWVALPRRPVAWEASPLRGWIDLAAADKKVLAILILGAAWAPLLALLPLYLGWLAVAAARRARQAGAPVGAGGALGLAALLVAKSGAMTAGRWWGSLRYGVLCL